MESNMTPIDFPTNPQFAALLPLLGTASAFFALIGVAFAATGTAMMMVM
jgi:hypothetical protein